MSKSNKIKYGLKNVHYAVITDNASVISYDQPKRIRGAVNINLSPKGDKAEFFADDMEYFGGTANLGYEGSVEIALIPDEFRIEVLNDEVDKNGALIENANTIPNDIALMFEFNGDVKANRHILYNVSVARPNVEGETKTQSIEPKTETLEITASPAIDTNDVKAKLEKGKPGYDTFFDSVYIRDNANNTGPASLVFSGEDLGIQIISDAEENSIKEIKLGNSPIAGVYLTIEQLNATIGQDFLGELPAETYEIKIILEKGNAVIIPLEIQE